MQTQKLALLAFACVAYQPCLGANVHSCPAGGQGPHCSQDAGLLSDDHGILSLIQREAALLRQKVVGSDPREVDVQKLSLLQLVSNLKRGGMSSATTLLQTVKELAMADVQGEFGADPITSQVLQSIIDQMNENVINVTLINHREDQREINRSIAVIENCTTTMQMKFAEGNTGVNALNAKQASDNTTHYDCRSRQVGLNSTQVAECNDFHLYAHGLHRSKPKCLCSFPKGHSPAKLKCIQLAKGWAITANSTYITKRDECDTATYILRRKQLTCDSNQRTFESAFCSYAQSLTTTCKTYTTCRSKSISTHNTTISDVRVSEAARKAEYKAAKKVICYIGVFTAADTAKPKAYSDCNAATYSTTLLDIVYPPIPTVATCDVSPVDDKPCDHNFLSTYYAGKAWSTQAPATKCTPCEGSPPAPVPATTTAPYYYYGYAHPATTTTPSPAPLPSSACTGTQLTRSSLWTQDTAEYASSTWGAEHSASQTVKSSGTGQWCTSGHAFGGPNSTFPLPANSPEWIVYNLQTAKKICRIGVTQDRFYHAMKIVVQIAPAIGGPWTDVQVFDDLPGVNGMIELQLTSPSTSQFWRLNILETRYTNAACIQFIDFWEAEA